MKCPNLHERICYRLAVHAKCEACGSEQTAPWRIGGEIPRDVVVPISHALDDVARVFELQHGAAEHERSRDYSGRWKLKTAHEHLFAGLGHLASHLRGRTDEDHLALAVARLLLARAKEKEESR